MNFLTAEYVRALEQKLIMTQNKIELLTEDIECLHLCLDKMHVPRIDNSGNVYSMWGRVKMVIGNSEI